MARCVRDLFDREIEEGGRLSTFSLATLTLFMSAYAFSLLMGSMVFWRICTGT